MATEPTLADKPEHTAEEPQNMDNVVSLPMKTVKPERGKTQRQTLGGVLFEVIENDGVYATINLEEDNEKKIWLCSPLYVVASTDNGKEKETGVLLEWRGRWGGQHRLAIPVSMLHGDGLAVREILSSESLNISLRREAKYLFLQYIHSWETNRRALCTNRTGWHDEGFVLPEKIIGNNTDHEIIYQSKRLSKNIYTRSGTVEQWKEHIARLARGNSRLIFTLSAAFAAPLASLCGMATAGFHLVGASSMGKSSVIRAASSVYGKAKDYMRTWDATKNALESTAAIRNDCLLTLDELSQIDPKEAGRVAYMLGNGQGKERSSSDMTPRETLEWTLIYLSTGEISLAEHIRQAGGRVNAGQEVRLIEIDFDAGKGLGGFECLNGFANSQELADAITDRSNECYGAVGMTWLEKLAAMRGHDFTAKLKVETGKTARHLIPENASGQVRRVAGSFALVAVAGELATEEGLTGWEKGEVLRAVKILFDNWLVSFGTGNREEKTLIEQVRNFIEQHGASRFENISATEEQRVPNRAGFFRDIESGREFLVLAGPYSKEVCSGFNTKTVSSVLLKYGYLVPGKDGKASQVVNFSSLGKSTRCYVISPRLFGSEEG